jgi:hypothetical protein
LGHKNKISNFKEKKTFSEKLRISEIHTGQRIRGKWGYVDNGAK